jgi:Fe-Mn family superoxide dismutase
MSLITEYRKLSQIIEESERAPLAQDSLRYKRTDLDPVLSQATLDVHFGKLAKAYVDRFNKGEGDANFNYGGARLHNIYFSQFSEPKSGNKPSGKSLEIINDKYESFADFQEEMTAAAMGIQGSGWLYMDNRGEIRVIKNHEYKDNMKIVLLIDWWEHAWFLDYQSDKKKYLQNLWRIIDWDAINQRLV